MTHASSLLTRRPERATRKEKVRQHLTELLRTDAGEGRLPSIRVIAQETGVSVSSVYNVIRDFVRQGKIRTEIGSGSFVTTRPGQNHPFRIGFNTPAGTPNHASEHWKNGIISGIVEGASTRQPRVLLLPSITTDFGQVDEELLRDCDSVDALILFPSLTSKRLRDVYEKAGKPVVFLNPPAETATANFVSPDYYSASFRVGRAFCEGGRQRVAFVSHVDLSVSVSSQLRLSGLVAGIGAALGESVSCRIHFAGSAHEEDGERLMRKLLESGQPLPDAIYCVGDFLALGMMRVLREAGVAIPSTVSLIGGTGVQIMDPLAQGLTAMRQPLVEIGRTLLDMVCQRLHNPMPLPAIYLPLQFIGGSTTTEEENRLLNF